MERRKFSREFKLEAVKLVVEGGVGVAQAARDLDLRVNVLRKWVREQADPQQAFPGKGQMKPEQLEIERLRREVAKLKAERDILKKSRGGKSMRFSFIDAKKAEFPINRMCKVLGVSQSGFHAWKDRPACDRQRQDMVLLAHVRSAFKLSNGTYGSPRMTRELRDDGHPVGRRRTARLMRENGLQARQRRRFKRTTDSEHSWPVAPNLLGQVFEAEAPDQKWGVDISYIWTREGWLYLSIVLDLFSHRVVGWTTSDRLHRALALSALRKALAMRQPAAGLIHHSDRSSQYCAVDYQGELRRNGIRISMSGKGNCYDNAMVETFFKTLKSELVWRTSFHTRQDAEQAIARYIDGFYNPVRRHSALDQRQPG